MQRYTAEFRSAVQDGRATGHAAVFGQIAVVRGGLERVAPEAIQRSLARGRNVVALINHDPNQLLGTLDAGTLRLSQDELGLVPEIDFPDTSYANDLKVLMERGDVSKMSFGFDPRPGGFRMDTVNGRQVRTWTDVDVFDVSILTGARPAYSDTDVQLRSLDDAVDSVLDSPAVSAREQAIRIRARRLGA